MFPEQSQVTMSNGMRKPIEFVHAGNEVITAEGKRETVYRTVSLWYRGQLYKLSVDNGFRGIIATMEQKIWLVGNQPKYVNKLEVNDVLGDEEWSGNKPSGMPSLVLLEEIEKVKTDGMPVFQIWLENGGFYFVNGLAVAAGEEG